ncbi:MAG: putative zinc-binding protein [Syntrophales bacterium]
MKQKVSEECEGARSLNGVTAEKKEKENWYLPYMDKKTKGIEVEERKSPVAVFYCAGASNVGQATVVGSVRAADELGYEKAALLCLASISAGLANITKAARDAKGIVAIDGCPMHCALKTLNKADFAVDRHMTLSKDLEIPKNFNLNSPTDMAKIAEAVEREILEVYNR